MLRTSAFSIASRLDTLRTHDQRGTTRCYGLKIVISQTQLGSKVNRLSSAKFASLILVAIGYRVGQVRCIFTLPSNIQRKRPNASTSSPYLAYLELFTPFTENPEPHCKLYKISRSYSNMSRKGIVVSLDVIFRSCHLIPFWGQTVDRTWSSENVLDICDKFFLNSFSDHHMYLFV